MANSAPGGASDYNAKIKAEATVEAAPQTFNEVA